MHSIFFVICKQILTATLEIVSQSRRKGSGFMIGLLCQLQISYSILSIKWFTRTLGTKQPQGQRCTIDFEGFEVRHTAVWLEHQKRERGEKKLSTMRWIGQNTKGNCQRHQVNTNKYFGQNGNLVDWVFSFRWQRECLWNPRERCGHGVRNGPRSNPLM